MHPQSSARAFTSPQTLLRSGEVTARYKVLKENTDLLDRLVDVPMTREQCGQVLGYYMIHVYAMSPAGGPGDFRDDEDMLANARRELSALLQCDLNPVYFLGAARAGWQVHCRAVGYPLADGYEMWTNQMLEIELSTCIHYMTADIER